MVTNNILLTISGPNTLRPLVICLDPLQIVYMVNTKYNKRCSGVVVWNRDSLVQDLIRILNHFHGILIYLKWLKKAQKKSTCLQMVLDNFGSPLVCPNFSMSTSTCLFFQLHFTLELTTWELDLCTRLTMPTWRLDGSHVERLQQALVKFTKSICESWTIDLRHWKLASCN